MAGDLTNLYRRALRNLGFSQTLDVGAQIEQSLTSAGHKRGMLILEAKASKCEINLAPDGMSLPMATACAAKVQSNLIDGKAPDGSPMPIITTKRGVRRPKGYDTGLLANSISARQVGVGRAEVFVEGERGRDGSVASVFGDASGLSATFVERPQGEAPQAVPPPVVFPDLSVQFVAQEGFDEELGATADEMVTADKRLGRPRKHPWGAPRRGAMRGSFAGAARKLKKRSGGLGSKQLGSRGRVEAELRWRYVHGEWVLVPVLRGRRGKRRKKYRNVNYG